jgi:hypothetical protein
VSPRIRFHLDEHIDRDIARALRLYSIDVTTTVEAGFRNGRVFVRAKGDRTSSIFAKIK